MKDLTSKMNLLPQYFLHIIYFKIFLVYHLSLQVKKINEDI